MDPAAERRHHRDEQRRQRPADADGEGQPEPLADRHEQVHRAGSVVHRATATADRPPL
jgi:hypothetical protein